MKQIRKKRSSFKGLIYSSAVLAALSPSVEANAQETEPVDMEVSTEKIEVDSYKPMLREMLEVNEEIENQNLSLLKLMMTAEELHIQEKYELVTDLYNFISTYPDLDEVILTQIHKNKTQAVNEAKPVDWSLNDEMISKYEKAIVLTKNQKTELLAVPVTPEVEIVEKTNEGIETNKEKPNESSKEIKASDKEIDENNNVSEKQDTIEKTGTSKLTEEKGQEEMVDTISRTTKADELYNESIQSSAVTAAWYAAIEGYTKYPNDTRFEYAIEKAGLRSLKYADSLESKGNLTEALAYYGRTLDSPWLSKILSDRAQNSYDRVQTTISNEEEKKKEALYRASVESGSVTTAWYKALEGYNTYPDDARFKYAIEKAAIRSLKYADSLENKGNLSGALAYFDRTLDSPWLTKALTNRAQSSFDRVQTTISNEEEKKKEALYRASVESGSVTTAWYKALEGYNTYPDDARFKYAIEKAAVRSLNYADTLESKGDFTAALAYFGRTLDSPWLTNELTNRTQKSYDRVQAIINHGEEAVKEALYKESVESGSVTTAWYKALEGYNLYPDDARFKYAIEKAGTRSLNYADSLEKKGNLSGALAYFERTLDSPWLTEKLKKRATASKENILEGVEEKEKEALYNISVQAGSVTKAWYTALEGFNKYPEDARFKDAIEKAAVRSLDYADSLGSKGQASSSIPYYDRTLDAPWMTKKLIKRATISKAQMLKIVEEEDKEALYNASVNSPYVTDAWNKALEGYNKYPMDSRFKDAIRKAAERNLNYADSLESKGNGEGAISYYDRILNAPWMPNDLYERAFKSKEEVLKYLDSDYIYQEILKEKNQIIAWEMATKAVVDHPNDKRIAEYIKTQAAKILDKAISLHKGYEYENAIRHYDLLNTGPKELYDGEEIAEKYKVLAMNNLIPNHASYQNSYYSSTIKEALDVQMKRSPQTQSGGKWVNASRTQTEYYLNPDNFRTSTNSEQNAYKTTGSVTTSTLNVRSGSGKNFNRIHQIYAGQEVTIVNEKNNWYEIIYSIAGEARAGWVSSAYIKKDNKETVKHDFTEAYNPVGKITTAVLNVRKGPSTEYGIVTKVK